MDCPGRDEPLFTPANTCKDCREIETWKIRHDMSRNWIPIRRRAPTSEDADVQGCVLVWHEYNGCMLMNWHFVRENRFLMAWMPTPGRPVAYE